MRTYTDDELAAMLGELESDRIERKQSFSGDVPNDAREAICAFANDVPNRKEPGVLFIGVTDSGEPSGLPITDELLLSLANIKTDGNILPLPTITVEKRHLKGADVAVVTVEPSDRTPVRYKGRIWVRTGPRRSLANEQEERILNEKRKFNDYPDDLRPVWGANPSDLSRAYFEEEYLPKTVASEVLEANNRTYIERLASCGFVYSVDDPAPTVTGLLTLGKNPQAFLPETYIQFVKFNGPHEGCPIVDGDTISGRFSVMFEKIENKIVGYNHHPSAYDSDGVKNIVTHDYSQNALMQIVYNALQHRSYSKGLNSAVLFYWFSDRIEIYSPGGVFGDVTPETFGNRGKWSRF